MRHVAHRFRRPILRFAMLEKLQTLGRAFGKRILAPLSADPKAPKATLAARSTGTDYWKRAPIGEGEYGALRFRVATEPQELVDERGRPLTIGDLYSHASIIGGSGAGKTRYVLTQILESLFRATDLRNPEARRARKFGGLFLDGKCELTGILRWLAQRYDRTEDLLLFGPDHDLAIDPFNDPDALPSELGDLMITLKQAVDDGKTAQDPFWDAAGRKLFTSLFQLHRALVAAAQEGLIETPPPPISFSLLNLLVMDRGLPSNQAQITQAEALIKELREKAFACFEKLSRITNRVEPEIPMLLARIKKSLRSVLEEDRPTEDDAREAWLLRRSSFETAVRLLEGDPQPKLRGSPAACPLLAYLPQVRTLRTILYTHRVDEELYERAAGILEEVAHRFRGLMPHCELLPERGGELRDLFLDFLSEADQAVALLSELSRTPVPAPEHGPLQQWLEQYERVLRRRGVEPNSDEIYLYFRGEYLNIANERTSGSIGMTVSTLTSLMTQPPFSSMVRPGGRLTFRDVIDQGKIVVLDMNFARWRNAAKVASLLLKLDFFRAVLARKTLMKEDKTPINQERPVIYLCDEFATVATTGDWTGERGFFDKAREYRCACIIAFQSLAVLEGRLPKPEIEAILTNTATMIFLRNPHTATNEFASRLFGEVDRSDGFLSRGTQELLFDLNKPIAAQDFQINFRKDLLYSPYVFPKLKDGEAIVKLHPRFGRRSFKRVQFLLHLVPR
ncbi:Type IV secretory pathway, VirD4 component [Methylacidimicrobium sp. AP8]|nr:Type IV secretory pathway, VirD4 component [Methylacidimicrobium sp. AP8]